MDVANDVAEKFDIALNAFKLSLIIDGEEVNFKDAYEWDKIVGRECKKDEWLLQVKMDP